MAGESLGPAAFARVKLSSASLAVIESASDLYFVVTDSSSVSSYANRNQKQVGQMIRLIG